MSGNRTTDHIYDGIEEYDNNLPNWWLATLWLTVIYGIGYWGYYQTFGIGTSIAEAYEEDIAAALIAFPPPDPKEAGISNEELIALSEDPALVAEGAEMFKQLCVSCHASNAGGMIGPNLTDNAWLHGGKPLDIRYTIFNGWPDNGMTAWGPMIGEDGVRKLTAFVLSIRNTNVSGLKPQGEVEP